MKWTALLVVAVLAGAALTPARADDAKPIVVTDAGLVSGERNGNVEIFRGIPYASPPVGPLRWEPPQPEKPWPGTRDATTFGAICPQPPRPDAAILGGDQPQSEDCLFLNVWSFSGAHKAPVMVWIHGGAFRFGSSSSPVYHGGEFARDGVILVSLNYRLGALGFFAHPALTKAAAANAPLGNYGVMDQLAALVWVQHNIAAFGGDPANVTVFGESAGGESVLTLLTMPQAHGLFAKAIVESGGGWFAPRSLSDAEQAGVALAQSAGLGANATVDQLRALPADKLFDTEMKLGGAGPFVDGRVITQSATQSFAEGRVLPVPLVIGSNSYEASLMHSFHIPAAPVAAQIPAAAKSLYPGDTDAAADAYFTDTVMGAPARWIAERMSAAAPTYLYHFSYVASRRRGKMPGAQHGGEIPFVFGDWPPIFDAIAAPEDRQMEALVHSCWVAFAKTGAPDCTGVSWPRYTPQSDTLMEFDAGARPVTGFRKAQYDAIEHKALGARTK